MRKFGLLALAGMLVALLTASDVQAWGAFHVGYTRVEPGEIQHYGRTVAAGPYGAYSGAHATGYSAYGSAYSAGGFRAAGVSGYRAGAYRAW